MQKLRKQVNEGLESVNVFRNIHENDVQYVHCHILAVVFYLDHYDEEEDKESEKQIIEN